MTISIEAFTKVLDQSMAEGVYNVTIPSKGETKTFKTMTAGQLKSVAKLAVGGDEAMIDFQVGKLGLIETLCCDEINFKEITTVDFISITAQVFTHNVLENITMILDCDEPECDAEFHYSIDFQGIINNCSAVDQKTDEYEGVDPINDTKYKFNLASPSIEDMTHAACVAMGADISTMDYMSIILLAHVKGLECNGEAVEGFLDESLMDRFKLLEKLPSNLIYGTGSLTEYIDKEFDTGSGIIDQPSCPACGAKMEGVITLDSFFII